MSTYSGTPDRTNIATSVDYIAQLVDLYRLPGEDLATFKDRVLDKYVHPGGVTYDGLYNGMSRELGVDAHSSGILIDVRRDSNGLPVLNNVGVKVSPRYLNIYSDHLAETVDTQFDLHDRTDSFFITDLLTNINALSDWEAVGVSINDYDKAQYLQQNSSLQSVKARRLSGSKVNNLSDDMLASNFIVGNLLFSSSSGFNKEVLSTPASAEEFMVDYNNNIIFTSIPSTGHVTFTYAKLPLLIKWSPVSIHTFKDSEFLDLITEQVRDSDDNTVDGLPTQEGAEYINELLSVAPMYWGK